MAIIAGLALDKASFIHTNLSIMITTNNRK
jgi:hypothetical protein